MSERMSYREALDRSGILESLAQFDPHVAGTLPLGIGVAGSDIDILCHAPDLSAFAETLWSAWGGAADFQLFQQTSSDRAVVASFVVHGWMFEIFGQALPVARQYGWRHFLLERQLLEIGGDPARNAVLELRARGLKTEPAFAELLGLDGDPYAALLTLEQWEPARLAEIVARRVAAFGSR